MALDLLEQEMRAALGLPESSASNSGKGQGVLQEKTSVKKLTATRSVRLKVVLSVRKNGGNAQRFEHVVHTLSEIDATAEAKKKAAAEGLTYWALLDIEKLE